MLLFSCLLLAVLNCHIICFPPVIPPQVVPGDSQENGQTNEEEEVEKTEREKPRRASRDKRKNSVSEEALETQTSVKQDGEAKKGKLPHWRVCGFLIAVDCWVQISLLPSLFHQPSGSTFLSLITVIPVFFTQSTHSSHFVIFPSVTPSDSLVRRSISQQKSGVSVTIDDPVRTTKQPSPPHGKVSNIIHVTNLVGL